MTTDEERTTHEHITRHTGQIDDDKKTRKQKNNTQRDDNTPKDDTS